MANPTTYASAREYLGIAVEATAQGTPAVPVTTIPINSFNPYDQPTWIDDTALRGSMTAPFNRVAGPNHTEFDMAGPAYFDSIGYLLSNIYGDITYQGTYTGSGTTTLSTSTIVGATTISTPASISNGTVIQIDTGANSEIRTTSGVTGSGPFILTVAALSKPHNSTVVVKPVTTPNSQLYAVLNSGNGQPSSFTLTDFQGPTATAGMRAYPGCCLSELSMSGTVESSAITYTAKGMGWPSAPAVTFASAPSGSLPQASWESQIGLAGTVGGAPVKTINDFGFTWTRAMQIYYTAQNSQNPYSIFRGPLTLAGTLNFVVADETALTYLTSNTQPQFQLIISNGLSGASMLSMQIDLQQCAFTTSKISRGNPAVEYAVTFDAIANSTNTGFSGGLGPATVTMQNAVAAGSF
jgi:hypothetical protein